MDSHLHATTQSIWQLLADFQHNRFKLAEMKTEVQIGRVFLDRCIELHLKGKLDVEAAAMRKYWLSELECRVVDQCVQMHGGYGYMLEYPIARAYADARVRRIYGGSNDHPRVDRTCDVAIVPAQFGALVRLSSAAISPITFRELLACPGALPRQV
jgi:alkylation response protein AidB-like acyl-CoA dehydrogenase